jgi:hypothetical protein
MTDREERLEQIKIYRQAARDYFNTRSNLTYINIIGCGAVAVLFAKNLVDAPSNCYIAIVQDHFWLYFSGLIVIVALAAWVTSICNLLSNSFYSYMLMVRELEDDIQIQYPTPKSWAVTFEFLTKKEQQNIYGPALRGNVWNIANAFLALCGVYAMIVLSEISQVGLLFWLAGAVFAVLVFLVVYLTVKEFWWRSFVTIAVLGILLAPIAATHAQRAAILRFDPFSTSVWHDPSTVGCDDKNLTAQGSAVGLRAPSQRRRL